MGVCRICDYYVKGICPSGTPWRDRCIFHNEIQEETKTLMTTKDVPIIRKKDLSIYEDYKSGMTTNELATKYNVHAATIRRSLKLQGVDLKADKELARELEIKIVDDARSGLSYQEIAKKYGITKYRVKELKRKHGLMKEPTTKEVTKTKPKKNEDSGVSFIFRADGKKPHKDCYPVEKDEYLAWGITINSLDELLELVDSINDGALVIRKRELDVLDVTEDSYANDQ